MTFSCIGQAQDIIDLVRTQVVMGIFAVNVVIIDITAAHKEVASFHIPEGEHTNVWPLL